jgi:hypothetical protein
MAPSSTSGDNPNQNQTEVSPRGFLRENNLAANHLLSPPGCWKNLENPPENCDDLPMLDG